MARTPASAAASRIRIEDEVWEEAFSSRVPARRPRASGSLASARPAGSPRASGSLASARPARPPRPYAAPPALRVAEPPPALADSTARPFVDATAPKARRTVRIQGRGADPYRSDPSRPVRSAYRPSPMGRVDTRPDRLAMWAALLGFLLVVVAILSSHF